MYFTKIEDLLEIWDNFEKHSFEKSYVTAGGKHGIEL